MTATDRKKPFPLLRDVCHIEKRSPDALLCLMWRLVPSCWWVGSFGTALKARSQSCGGVGWMVSKTKRKMNRSSPAAVNSSSMAGFIELPAKKPDDRVNGFAL